MSRDIPVEAIDFARPLPIKHMVPNGYMPMSTESAALWQFLIMAFQALDRVEKQVTYTDEQDQVVDLNALVYSAFMIYELLDTPANRERVFNPQLVNCAKMEARRSGLPWDTRIDAWFSSGGKSYNLMERNPDKVGE